MEFADIQLALGGDKGNTVPKRVTVPELGLLRAIHGEDAVFDIRPVVSKRQVDPRMEMARLREEYQAQDADGRRIFELTYPGANPVAPLLLSELHLPSELFAAVSRLSPDTTIKRGPGRPRKNPLPATVDVTPDAEPDDPDADIGDDLEADPVEEETASNVMD